MDEKRKSTIIQMVRNYNGQVEIVGHTSLTPEQYLTNVGLNKEELQFADYVQRCLLSAPTYSVYYNGLFGRIYVTSTDDKAKAMDICQAHNTTMPKEYLMAGIGNMFILEEYRQHLYIP